MPLKNYFYIALLSVFVLASGCKKIKPFLDSGNSFSFFNGTTLWKPAGNNGTARLKLQINNGRGNGGFSIAAYRILSDTDREYFGLGLMDGLQTIVTPASFPITKTGLVRLHYTGRGCSVFSHDENTDVSGSPTVTRYDREKRVMEGKFEARLTPAGCAEVILDQGQFVISY